MKTILSLFTIAICFTACQSAKQNTDNTEASVQTLEQIDLTKTLKEKNVVLIDVRTPEEVAEGYIQGASHFIDFYSDDFQTKVKELDNSKTYVMYCRSGGRSGKAAQFMVENGFKNVYNLEGGISAYTGQLGK